MTDQKITVTLPDGSTKEYSKGTTCLEVAQSISEGLGRAALFAKVDGKTAHLNTKLTEDSKVELITFHQEEGKDALRHSCAHLLAASVLELYPGAQNAIGPSIKDGFYQDFELPKPISEEDFPKIEEKMHELAQRWNDTKEKEVTREEALEQFKWNKYKTELIHEFSKGGKKITFQITGDFIDLCKGGHVDNAAKHLKYFKLQSVAGAYWRGDEKNIMLTRIYGTAFHNKSDLKKHLHNLEEAKKRDHRKLGKELDLFSFNELSPGSPFFHPKGTIIYLTLQNFLREKYMEWGYQEVVTPLIYGKGLWEQSGHWKLYKENMFCLHMDHKEASLKPMNCPSHILIFKTKLRSYRDLPIRIADFAPLHRNELKGVLGGLTRVRKFSQDDCHVFCRQDQIKEEIGKLIQNVRHVYKEIFNFDFSVELSTKPEKALGDATVWEMAEGALKDALEENKVKYKLNPGDGAFYGPKIDFHIKDSLGRSWQCATEQLDFQQPERFKIQYEGQDGKKHNVVMLHRTVIGSLERFMGILIEHFAGKFPLWLSPMQMRILTVADRHEKYAHSVEKEMKKVGLRVEVDARAESISKKVREAQLQQINYILVVGDKEQEGKTVTVRTRNNEVIGAKQVDAFITQLLKEIKTKEIK